MTFENPLPKLLLRKTTTGANCTMNKTEFTAITFIQGAIGFGFASQKGHVRKQTGAGAVAIRVISFLQNKEK